MKTIGFIDDSEYELAAFLRVVGGRDGYNVVTASNARDFLQRLECQKEVHLLLFDLYFPIPGEASRETLTSEDLTSKLGGLRQSCVNLERAETSDSQLAMADFVRRRADALMKELLSHYAQGPSGGLKVFREVQQRYPLVPAAFLSRKRSADDIRPCLEAGALDVLLKPEPKREYSDADASTLAVWGWEDHLDTYLSDFEVLMSQNVVEAHLTRIQEMLGRHHQDRSAEVRRLIDEARHAWTSREHRDVPKAQSKLREALQQYYTSFGATATYELISFLVGVLTGGVAL